MSSTLRNALPVRNPRTGEIDLHITPAPADEVAAAAGRLRAAQKAWGAAPLEHRIAVMSRWAEAIRADRQAIIDADAADTGYGQVSQIAPDMMLGAIFGGIRGAPAAFEAARRQGVSPNMPHVKYDSVLKPYPLVGVISPWNAPTMLSMLHVIPPLFAGCAVLLKPSEVTPRFTRPLMETVRRIPELAAVFEVVLGDGETGQAVVDHADLISFTGSVGNGRRVAEACARRFIPCELELGGKDPVVITETADLDKAVNAVVRGALTSTGQVCFSVERVYVHESVHDAFVEKLVAKAERVPLNYPDRFGGPLSPFIFARQAEIVADHILDAVSKGARVRTGGEVLTLGGGLYMKATVLTDVNHEMKVMRDETFGPVVPVMRYRDADEAVALANDTYFGLSAAVIAGTEAEARAIGERIDAGNVSIQDAFLTFAAGAVESDSFRMSGLGGKRSGVQRYLKRQGLLINTADPADLLEDGLKAAE
ncbi:MAG: aldehyde dehydrogenase family protein [Caulobacteraceae bacterium]